MRAWALCLVSVLVGCAGAAVERREAVRIAEPAAAAPEPVTLPPVMDVRVLLVRFKGAVNAAPELDRSEAESKERAQRLARMGRSGKFGELVRTYSEREGAAEDGGLVRIQTASSRFSREVLEAAARLSPGEISEPLRTDEGYLVVERRPDPPAGPTMISARHILISFKGAERAVPDVTRSREQAQQLAQQIVRDARAEGADWGALASKYTDEPGAAVGGDLGRFGRGQMVPSFERAAFELEVGATSEVVETPYGFHVIQRYE